MIVNNYELTVSDAWKSGEQTISRWHKLSSPVNLSTDCKHCHILKYYYNAPLCVNAMYLAYVEGEGCIHDNILGTHLHVFYVQ